jgi:hypothetical protein
MAIPSPIQFNACNRVWFSSGKTRNVVAPAAEGAPIQNAIKKPKHILCMTLTKGLRPLISRQKAAGYEKPEARSRNGSMEILVPDWNGLDAAILASDMSKIPVTLRITV